MTMKWAIAVGNINTGFEFYGPFKSESAAIDFGQRQHGWHIIRLQPTSEEIMAKARAVSRKLVKRKLRRMGYKIRRKK